MRDCSKEISKFESEEVALPAAEKSIMHKKRNTNRDRLKNGLDRDSRPKPIGCHTQGSYAMRTMIQDEDGDYDIDDGVYFRKQDLAGKQGGEMSALSVRQMVCEALQDDRFEKQPEVLKNCVRVAYSEGHHVDVPAYRRMETKDQWTGKEIYTYELASSDWKDSDARSVTDWFKTENERHSPGHEQFRRIVRLIKKFTRSRPSWKGHIATGFMVSKLVSEKFISEPDREDISLRETLRAIKARLDGNDQIAHPTLPENITKDGDGRPGYLRDRLAEKLPLLEVLDDASCTHAAAMKAWDDFFNTDWFSQQPEPDDDQGGGWGGGFPSVPRKPVDKQGGGRFA